MNNLDEDFSFYNEALNLIDMNNYEGAIKVIKMNIDNLKY